MANLKYSDKHNMVAFLKKPNESVGFTEVVDFLKGTSLRYALTYNHTIYDFLVKQFWQTATVKTLANRTQQLVASIDSKEYTITEASVRSKLHLADATRIHNLSDAELYAGLATLSPKSGGWDQFGSTIATALICLSSNRGQLWIKVKAQHNQLNPITHLLIQYHPHPIPPHQSPPHSPLPHSPPQSPPHFSPHRSYETPLPEENWDTIRAKLEANAELSKDLLGQDLPEQDFAKRMVDMNQGTWKLSKLKKLKFEEIEEEFDKLVQQIDTFVPINL
ncbi:hypothetical protein Tco_0462832 [Tanacetum coccineum]